MDLSVADVAGSKTDHCDALQFPPTPRTVLSSDPHYLSNSSAYCDCFDILNGSKNFKIHRNPFAILTIWATIVWELMDVKVLPASDMH